MKALPPSNNNTPYLIRTLFKNTPITFNIKCKIASFKKILIIPPNINIIKNINKVDPAVVKSFFVKNEYIVNPKTAINVSNIAKQTLEFLKCNVNLATVYPKEIQNINNNI